MPWPGSIDPQSRTYAGKPKYDLVGTLIGVTAYLVLLVLVLLSTFGIIVPLRIPVGKGAHLSAPEILPILLLGLPLLAVAGWQWAKRGAEKKRAQAK